MRKIRYFFWGILTALASLFLIGMMEIIISSIVFEPLSQNDKAVLSTFYFMAFSVFIEEILKYLVILRIKKNGFEEKTGNIVFKSFFVGLGFAAMECFLILTTNEKLDAFVFGGMAKITIVHVATAIILGFMSSFKGTRLLPKSIFFLLVPFLLHFTYNMSQAEGLYYLSTSSLLLLLIFSLSALFKMKKTIKSFA